MRRSCCDDVDDYYRVSFVFHLWMQCHPDNFTFIQSVLLHDYFHLRIKTETTPEKIFHFNDVDEVIFVLQFKSVYTFAPKEEHMKCLFLKAKAAFGTNTVQVDI